MTESLNRLVSSLVSTPNTSQKTPQNTASNNKDILGVAAREHSEELYLQDRKKEDEDKNEDDEDEEDDEDDEDDDEDDEDNLGAERLVARAADRTGGEFIVCNCKRSRCLKLYAHNNLSCIIHYMQS